MGDGRPTLWQLEISHYSEKARWALDLKRVPHVRRDPMGGLHMPIAFAKTQGASFTFPVLEIDGATIGDSTAIIAELERRFPERPLYPADPADRQRALAIEDYFDERVGPAARLFAWHEVTRDGESLRRISTSIGPPVPEPLRAVGAFATGQFLDMRYRVTSDDRAGAARRSVLEGFDRIEAELESGDGEHLVGTEFSIADLTAATLLYPIVRPDEGPQVLGTPPPGLERFGDELAGRPGFAWVKDTFRRYRRA